VRNTRAKSARATIPSLPDDSPAKTQLDRILNSKIFAGARRSQLFLRYIVAHALAHPDEPLKEYSIALDVFDRDPSYDPAVNNTVRVEAGRLRSRLTEYYAGDGHADPLLIEVPRGAYRAIIRPRESSIVHAAPSPTSKAATPTRGLRYSWAIAAAFILGALLGYRAPR
jgi:hypothetical protein